MNNFLEIKNLKHNDVIKIWGYNFKRNVDSNDVNKIHLNLYNNY